MVKQKTLELIGQGDDFFRNEQFEQANESYDRAIEIDPNYASSWYKKGRALFKLGKYEDGTKCFIKSSEIEAKSTSKRIFIRDARAKYTKSYPFVSENIRLVAGMEDRWFRGYKPYLYFLEFDISTNSELIIDETELLNKNWNFYRNVDDITTFGIDNLETWVKITSEIGIAAVLDLFKDKRGRIGSFFLRALFQVDVKYVEYFLEKIENKLPLHDYMGLLYALLKNQDLLSEYFDRIFEIIRKKLPIHDYMKLLHTSIAIFMKNQDLMIEYFDRYISILDDVNLNEDLDSDYILYGEISQSPLIHFFKCLTDFNCFFSLIEASLERGFDIFKDIYLLQLLVTKRKHHFTTHFVTHWSEGNFYEITLPDEIFDRYYTKTHNPEIFVRKHHEEIITLIFSKYSKNEVFTDPSLRTFIPLLTLSPSNYIEEYCSTLLDKYSSKNPVSQDSLIKDLHPLLELCLIDLLHERKEFELAYEYEELHSLYDLLYISYEEPEFEEIHGEPQSNQIPDLNNFFLIMRDFVTLVGPILELLDLDLKEEQPLFNKFNRCKELMKLIENREKT